MSEPIEVAPGVFEHGPPGVPSVMPAVVTMRQARLALHAAGKLALVQTAIDALSEPDRTAAQITWDHSIEVQRTHPFVQMLAPALNLDGAALDALFENARTL